MGWSYDGMRFNFSERAMMRHFREYYKHNRNIKLVPRKTKKAIIGKKMSKRQLKALLRKVQIIPNKYPEQATILPNPFCPKCGCEQAKSSGSMATYPERWVIFRCARCNYKVGESDNSPYMHVLEFMFGEDKDDFDPKYWE